MNATNDFITPIKKYTDNAKKIIKKFLENKMIFKDFINFSSRNKIVKPSNKYGIKYVFKLIQKANKGITNKKLSKLFFFFSRQVIWKILIINISAITDFLLYQVL